MDVDGLNSNLPQPPAVEAMRRRKTAIVYDKLAQLLPVEGRDWTIKFRFDDGCADPHITMVGITPLGKMWIDHCAAEFRKDTSLGTKEQNVGTIGSNKPNKPDGADVPDGADATDGADVPDEQAGAGGAGGESAASA